MIVRTVVPAVMDSPNTCLHLPESQDMMVELLLRIQIYMRNSSQMSVIYVLHILQHAVPDSFVEFFCWPSVLTEN